MRRHFHKMHGLGNDFVIIDGREHPVEIDETLARALCDRQRGVGCDQLILIEPSDVADVRMRIWNDDGGEVESCGNASRCVVALTGAGRIETSGGIVKGGAEGDQIEVVLPEPRFDWADIPLAYPMDTTALPMAWGELGHPFAVNVGNPHLVFLVPDARTIDLESLGPAIENDPAFPDRINVNVATFVDNILKLRTFERGAGETLACGTGACATAVAAIAQKVADSPVEVHMSGGRLTIEWRPGGPIRMTGGATHVFEGDVDLAALA